MTQLSSLVRAHTVRLLRRALVTATVTALALSTASAAPDPPKSKMDTPNISCAGSTQVSINVQVCAPAGAQATGAPAGFSLQWMTLDDYIANGSNWYSSDDPRLCHASFSGNANASRYKLAAGECVTVNVGDLLFDNGTSANCAVPLVCGTEYVYRSFAHATSTLMRSDFTSPLECATLPCGSGDTCTWTQGYWKTHGPIPEGNNSDEWPVDSLTLGTVSYTDDQLLAILQTPAKGNGLIALAHQLIAAKLNVENGADATAIAGAIAQADSLIGSLVIPPVGSGFLSPSLTSTLTTTLATYNEGATGPGHCGGTSTLAPQ